MAVGEGWEALKTGAGAGTAVGAAAITGWAPANPPQAGGGGVRRGSVRMCVGACSRANKGPSGAVFGEPGEVLPGGRKERS